MNKNKVLTLTLAGLLSTAALVGCGEKNTLAKEALNGLAIDTSYKQASASFAIPKVLNYKGTAYQVEWTEESDYIEFRKWDDNFTNVVVTRPGKDKGNTEYELTAKVTADGVSATKSFKGLLMAYQADPVIYSDIKTIFDDIELDTLKLNSPIEFTGTVANIVGSSGLYIVDAKGNSIYNYGGAAEFKVGDEVKVSGGIAAYHSMYQFSGAKLEGLSRGNEVTLPTYEDKEMTVAELVVLNPQKGHLIHGKQTKITGVVDKSVSGKYTDYYLRDLEDSSKKVKFNHYAHTEEELAKLDTINGKVFTADFTYYCNYDDKGFGYVNYLGDFEKLPEATEIPADKFFKYYVGSFSPKVVYETALPKEMTLLGQKFATKYTVTDEEGNKLINEDGTLVNADAKATLAKTFKIEYTQGEKSQTIDYSDKKVLVGKATVSNVKEVMTAENKEVKHFIELDIMANSYNEYFVGDAAGTTIAIKAKGLTIPLGKKVKLYGNFLDQYGTRLFAVDQVIKVSSSKLEYDFNAAKAFTLSEELKTALAAKVPADKILENATFKALTGEFYDVVKVTATVTSGKYGLSLKADGIDFGTNDDMVKASGAKEGDTVTAYVVINGFKTSGKPSFVEKIKAYTVKVTK